MIRFRHLKMAGRYVAHRFRELHPFEVEANLLNSCNLQCVYCRCPEIKTKPMTTEQWRAVINRLGALGTIRFKFHGGEPTLRPDFRELSFEVKKAGITAAANTNGQIIPSKPELLDYLDELIVSLDSPTPETNDRLRGEGSYRKAVQTIDLSLQRGVRTFVNMVLTRQNLSDLEEMLEFCKGKGVLMNVQPVAFDRGRYGYKKQIYALTNEQIREVHLNLVKWKRQGRGLIFSAQSYQKVADWPDHSILSVRSSGKSPCVAGRDYIYIDANGDVIPCCQYESDFRPKNIVKDGLDEALRHVRSHDCGECWRVYYNERLAVFRRKPYALREVFRRS